MLHDNLLTHFNIKKRQKNLVVKYFCDGFASISQIDDSMIQSKVCPWQLTHWVFILGRSRPTHREGVGVDVADLSLGLDLGLARCLSLRGCWPNLRHRHRTPICPVFLAVDSCRPIDHRHAIRAHQPLEKVGKIKSEEF